MRNDSEAPSREHAPAGDLAGLRLAQVALFLDVDGTLLELAETPDAVCVDTAVKELLRILCLRTAGAVALVSGRSIAALDALFAPLLLPAAGLHGFERRSATGAYCRHVLPPGAALDQARRLMTQMAARHAGLMFEDKQFALALHYRQAPELESHVIRAVEAIAHVAGTGLQIQRGRRVIELRPASAAKGSAVAEFMTEPPFRGRRPVCIGDDLTDESAFEWANSVGGLSIAVNVSRDTAATVRLPSVAAAREWLHALAERTESRLSRRREDRI